MISARFFYAGEVCKGCTISGHAGYADAGNDVICAYASSAVQTVANLMTDVFHLPVSVEEEEDNAAVVIRLTGKDSTGNAQRLFIGLEMQLSELAKIFPANIQMIHTEV